MSLRILSLGAGVQSTTLALMAAKGEIEMPDCAIFADTGWEPRLVYGHLWWLQAQLPYPVYIVSHGNLREDTLRGSSPTGGRLAAVPWHGLKKGGERGMGRRQCTTEYKLRPLQKMAVELGARRTAYGCTMLIGISTDEASRMKPSRVKYIVNEFPLLDLGMSRKDCLAWMQKYRYPEPPKSSCLGCPFHDDRAWRRVKDSPEEWAETLLVDAAIRNQPKMRMRQFMHRSCKPLGEVDLMTLEEHGQINMFENECEGMCGV